MITNANPIIKQNTWMLLVLMFAMLSLFGCQNQNIDETIDEISSPVVAKVGGKVFYEVDIDYEILSMPESMRYLMQDATARAKVLDVMIKREAVAQKAREMGLDSDPLVTYRMHQAKNSVLIQSVREWQKHDVEKFGDKQIEEYYKKHVNDFVIPEQIHVRHILLSDKQKALDILKILKKKPNDFSTLAAQYSIDDSNKGRGGDLNWFAKGAMVKPFEKVAFALSEKHPLSQPVKTVFGWHIIQWLGKKEGSTLSLADVKDELISILRKKSLNDWIKSVVDNADIVVLDPEYTIKP